MSNNKKDNTESLWDTLNNMGWKKGFGLVTLIYTIVYVMVMSIVYIFVKK